jgi:hypothetical protein
MIDPQWQAGLNGDEGRSALLRRQSLLVVGTGSKHKFHVSQAQALSGLLA